MKQIDQPQVPGMQQPQYRPLSQQPRPLTTTAPKSPAPMQQQFRPITESVANMGGPPNANLRSDVYTPGGDPRLAGAQGATDAAGAGIQNAPTYSAMAGANTARYRGLFGSGNVAAGPAIAGQDSGRYLTQQDAAVNALGGPNRTELAKQALADFDTSNAEGLQQRYRTVGQNAARLGRLGMGDTGKQAIDVGRQYEQDRMLYANDLARSVAEGDIGDRYRTVSAVSGLRGQESGIESGLRNENRGERDYTTGLAERNAGRDFDRIGASINAGGRDATADTADRYNRYDTARNLEDLIYGQGVQNRGEMRTERGRQDTLAQQDLENRLKQHETEGADQQADWYRKYLQSQLGAR